MQELGNNRQKKRGQHYNPIFYLKHFSTERNGKYYIWCFNKETGESFETNIKNIGKESWFYDRHNIFEDALSILDGHHSTIYKMIETMPIYALIEQEKRLIAEFIYLTHVRTRKAREDILPVNQDVYTMKNLEKNSNMFFQVKLLKKN